MFVNSELNCVWFAFSLNIYSSGPSQISLEPFRTAMWITKQNYHKNTKVRKPSKSFLFIY